jgi:hypothetical protein
MLLALVEYPPHTIHSYHIPQGSDMGFAHVTFSHGTTDGGDEGEDGLVQNVQQLTLPGLKVNALKPDGQAQRQGVVVGDVIVGLNDFPLMGSSLQEYSVAVKSAPRPVVVNFNCIGEVDLLREVQGFYSMYNPSKISEVCGIVDRWTVGEHKGKQLLLMQALKQKYNAPGWWCRWSHSVHGLGEMNPEAVRVPR